MQRSLNALTPAVAALFLSACQPPAPPEFTAEQKLAGRAVDAVRDTLNDPTTAQFKDLLPSVKGHCVVGRVLAKNAFGAFTGYHGFVWNGSVMTDDDPRMLRYVKVMTDCLDSRV